MNSRWWTRGDTIFAALRVAENSNVRCSGTARQPKCIIDAANVGAKVRAVIQEEAQAYASVVLIDGLRLAQLMIDFNVGVSAAHTYEIKRIDSDYFAEE